MHTNTYTHHSLYHVHRWMTPISLVTAWTRCPCQSWPALDPSAPQCLKPVRIHLWTNTSSKEWCVPMRGPCPELIKCRWGILLRYKPLHCVLKYLTCSSFNWSCTCACSPFRVFFRYSPRLAVYCMHTSCSPLPSLPTNGTILPGGRCLMLLRLMVHDSWWQLPCSSCPPPSLPS